MGVVAETTTRVLKHTPEFLNERISKKTRQNIARHAEGGEGLGDRLRELDREWDIERVLEANASSLVILGVLLGAFVNRWLLVIPFLVGSFLLQHAIQGWCPPVRLFRRLGFRTHAEIATEHYALRVLRGDFDRVVNLEQADAVTRSAEVYRLARWGG